MFAVLPCKIVSADVLVLVFFAVVFWQHICLCKRAKGIWEEPF